MKTPSTGTGMKLAKRKEFGETNPSIQQMDVEEGYNEIQNLPHSVWLELWVLRGSRRLSISLHIIGLFPLHRALPAAASLQSPERTRWNNWRNNVFTPNQSRRHPAPCHYHFWRPWVPWRPHLQHLSLSQHPPQGPTFPSNCRLSSLSDFPSVHKNWLGAFSFLLPAVPVSIARSRLRTQLTLHPFTWYR